MARTVAEADRGCGACERSRARQQALIAYLDTSAFVKLLVAEPGSADAAATWIGADRRISSLMLYPEARAAVARAGRMGRLGRNDLQRARRRIETLWAVIDRLDLTAKLAREAGDMAETHGLRAYDAVHLASAVSVADEDLVLVAADGDLLAAARTFGLATTALV